MIRARAHVTWKSGLVIGAGALFACSVAQAWNEPGAGLTANLEIGFLKMMIDHHYGALRMTELAAGTEATRDAQISSTEGTSPSPGFAATPPRAKSAQARSLARRDNRVQREEILQAEQFLHDWYGITYHPQLTTDMQSMIQQLEQAQAGEEFERLFLRMFSYHHFTALGPATECLTGRDLRHAELHRYCENIIISQTGDIDEMRELLCKEFKLCDLQPFTPPAGKSSLDTSGGS